MPVEQATGVLLGSAATLALVHTAIGVDHVAPFVALSRASGWGLGKTLGITLVCGLGHVLTSVLIGLVGIGIGSTLEGFEALDSVRGSLAAWLLMGFGLAYMAWAGWRLWRSTTHQHLHTHADGTVHAHPHDHHGAHAHPHGAPTPGVWALFIIFALGPCESLIPLMMAPAAAGNTGVVLGVIVTFTAVTLLTMVGLVAGAVLGLGRVTWPGLSRYAHLIAGASVVLSGVAVEFLGL